MRLLGALMRTYLVLVAGMLLIVLPRELKNHVKPAYEVEIIREAATPQDAEFIAAAETICPPYEEVAAVFQGVPPPEGTECLWWYGEGGIRSPFAITGDAVDYFVALLASWEFEERETSASLRYEARVERESEDGPVVVRMTLRLDTFCGGCCGYGFTKSRHVYFDAAGQATLVAGDGPLLDAWVS